MNYKIFETRIALKHDLTINWDNSGFVGLAGELIVYDDRYTIEKEDGTTMRVPGIKICDGVTTVDKLPFTSYTVDNMLADHEYRLCWHPLGEENLS